MAEITETNPKGAGAPEGNQNSSKNNRLWAETIKRVLIQEDVTGKKIRAIANALIDKASDGDISAIKELGDRLDGKVNQSIDTTITGELTITKIERAIVDSANTDT
jgi:hypothetical protein